MPDVAPAAAPAVAPVTPANGAAPVDAKAAPPAEEFLEYVVEGKTERIAKSKALERLRKESFADKRSQQAAEALKAVKAREAQLAAEAEEDKKLAEENEEEWLRKRGRDPEAFARKYLEKKLRESEMTEDQRKAATAERERDELKKQVEAHTKEKSEAEVNAQAARIRQHMSDDLHRASVAAGLIADGAPMDGDTFAIIQALVQDSFDAGFPVDADWAPRIIEAAKEQMAATSTKLEKAVLGGLKGEALEARLGKTVVDELMRHRLEKLRGKRTFGQPKAADAPPVERAKPANPYMSVREADDALRKHRMGLK